MSSWGGHFRGGQGRGGVAGPSRKLGILHSPILDAVRGGLIVIQDPDGNCIRLYTLESHGPEIKPATNSPRLAG